MCGYFIDHKGRVGVADHSIEMGSMGEMGGSVKYGGLNTLFTLC